jgi:hypothetical protein
LNSATRDIILLLGGERDPLPGPKVAPGNDSTNSMIDLGTPEPPVKQPRAAASARTAIATRWRRIDWSFAAAPTPHI